MKKTSQSGQSTIEFIFSFTFGVSIILLVFNSAMNYASGYLNHYATFMASRVYLTQESYGGTYGAGGISKAVTEATDAFAQYQLGIFGINTEIQFNQPNGGMGPAEYLAVGAYTQFEKKMDMIGQITGQNTVDMISESFLGKEPTRGICAARTCFAISGDEEGCSPTSDITLYDDGC